MNPQYNLYIIIAPLLIILVTWWHWRLKKKAILQKKEYINSHKFNVDYAGSQSDERATVLSSLVNDEYDLARTIKYRIGITVICIIPIVLYLILYFLHI